ncbi:MAG TPA: DeoR/GlpR family DNA-binding transcription regulator [Anaeromyxobacter sp.]|nr:DeoR/GlpR family DNA-binding transcription regulator [Anaeromyxobacter sp.]HVO19103.1 DeoR/GlpR family DNA-binding transcription regulator [Anaeromyxobacter sp.]
MFPEERRREIVARLRREGRCLVADLARHLEVSEVTIRQDLDALEREGQLRRTHGGAILDQKIGLERPFQIEESERSAEKERIATAATELVGPGDTLILDVGTTVTAAARKLVALKTRATVFTNGLNIAAILEADPEITTVVTGGTLRPKQHSLVNPFASLVFPRVHADLAFIGINGIQAEHGLTNVNAAEAEIKALFVRAARRRVVLADSTKVGKIALAKFAEVSDVDLLITDQGADSREVDALREAGLEVRLV